MSQPEVIPTTQTRINSIAKQLQSEDFMRQLSMALPDTGVTAARMARVCITEIRRNPKLAECSLGSLYAAIMQCAQVGLEPGNLGLAYLIPYGTECQFQLGYRGVLQLVWRSQQISSVQSEVVYARDAFEYSNGIPPTLRHVPATGDRGPATHAYACIGTKSGGWIFRVMTADEINDHRKRFSKAKASPWDTDWSEMACKTILKRTAKRAPISADAQHAISLDDRSELGISSDEIDVTPPGAQEPSATGSAAQAKETAAKAAAAMKGATS